MFGSATRRTECVAAGEGDAGGQDSGVSPTSDGLVKAVPADGGPKLRQWVVATTGTGPRRGWLPLPASNKRSTMQSRTTYTSMSGAP